MGYFNFYILKKILNNKKTRKFLFFILVFIAVLFLKNNVFASYTFTYNNVNYTLPDIPTSNYQYFTAGVFDYNAKNLYVYYTNVEPFIQAITSGGQTYYVITTGSGRVTYDKYAFYLPNQNGSWQTINQSTSTSGLRLTSEIYNFFTSPEQLKNSNKVIEVNYPLKYGETVIITPPEYFSEFPYFLNSTEDIALGEQDLIIMPGDFTNTKQFNFELLENNPEEIGAGGIQDVWTTLFNLTLDYDSPFYVSVDDSRCWFLL